MLLLFDSRRLLERGEGGTSLEPKVGVREWTDAGDDTIPLPPAAGEDTGRLEEIKEDDGDDEAKAFELGPNPGPEADVASYVRGDCGTAKVIVLAAVLLVEASDNSEGIEEGSFMFKVASEDEEDAKVPSMLNKAVSSSCRCCCCGDWEREAEREEEDVDEGD